MANRRKLGELLVAAGVLDEARLHAALGEQKKWGGKLGRILIDLGFVREELMVKALSHQLQLPAVDFERDLPSSEAISRMPVHLAEKYGVFPMAYDEAKKALTVASSDPTNPTQFRDMRLELGLRTVNPVVASASEIDRAIRRYYYGEQVHAVPTATPQHFGLSEQLIDLGVPAAGVIPGRGDGVSHMIDAGQLSRETDPVAPARPARPPPPPPQTIVTAAQMVSAGPPKLQPTVDPALAATVERLEALMGVQVRSLRTLIEMLVEGGLIDRDEYLRRVKEHR